MLNFNSFYYTKHIKGGVDICQRSNLLRAMPNLLKKSKNTKLHMVCHHLSVLFENSAKMHLKSKKSDIKENTK